MPAFQKPQGLCLSTCQVCPHWRRQNRVFWKLPPKTRSFLSFSFLVDWPWCVRVTCFSIRIHPALSSSLAPLQALLTLPKVTYETWELNYLFTDLTLSEVLRSFVHVLESVLKLNISALRNMRARKVSGWWRVRIGKSRAGCQSPAPQRPFFPFLFVSLEFLCEHSPSRGYSHTTLVKHWPCSGYCSLV